MDITSYLLGKNSGGGGNLNWVALGYSGTPQATIDGYNYALGIQQNWTPAANLSNKFKNNRNLMFMPLVDTSTATNMSSMFQYCYSLQKVANLDTSNVTSMSSTFHDCWLLAEAPQIDLSKATNIGAMFYGCTNLKTVPEYNISGVTNANISNMFNGCISLTNESLNNILKMCTTATFSNNKTLAYLGLTNTSYPAETIQGLSNYQAFLDAGWTIGY